MWDLCQCFLIPLTSVTLRKPEKSATTLPWVSITPLGFPVEIQFFFFFKLLTHKLAVGCNVHVNVELL